MTDAADIDTLEDQVSSDVLYVPVPVVDVTPSISTDFEGLSPAPDVYSICSSSPLKLTFTYNNEWMHF